MLDVDQSIVAKKKTGNGEHVLVVEDDKFLANLLTKKIRDAGYTVMHAPTGEDALRMMVTDVPNILVLDILLPGIDGLEVLKRVRADDRLKNIPAMFLTNLGAKEQIEAGKKLGVVNYFIKALVDLNEIVDEVQKTLAKKSK